MLGFAEWIQLRENVKKHVPLETGRALAGSVY